MSDCDFKSSFGLVSCAVLGDVIHRSAKPEGSSLTVDQLIEHGVYLSSVPVDNLRCIPVMSLAQLYWWSGMRPGDLSVEDRFAEVLRIMIAPNLRYEFSFIQRFHACKNFVVFIMIFFLRAPRLPFSSLLSSGFEYLYRRSQSSSLEIAESALYEPKDVTVPSSIAQLDCRRLLISELKDRVDLATLSTAKILSGKNKGKNLKKHASAGTFVRQLPEFNPEVAGVRAIVAASILYGSSGCVYLAAPNQPLFDILIDQKMCTVTLTKSGAPIFKSNGAVRYYVDCKWSFSALQKDEDLTKWLNIVKPFFGMLMPLIFRLIYLFLQSQNNVAPFPPSPFRSGRP